MLGPDRHSSKSYTPPAGRPPFYRPAAAALRPGRRTLQVHHFFIYSLTRPEEASILIQIPVPGVEVVGQAGPAKFNGERLGSPIVPPCSPSFLCCSSPTTS
jgi:hypothetical protein